MSSSFSPPLKEDPKWVYGEKWVVERNTLKYKVHGGKYQEKDFGLQKVPEWRGQTQSLWFSLLNVLTSLDSELRVTQAVVNLLSSESHMLG